MSELTVTRADICAVAVAECFRGDGETMASAMGITPNMGTRLAKATFEPDLLITDGFNLLLKSVLPLGQIPKEEDVEGYMPFSEVFNTLWWGRRHVMMGASQLDQYGNQNISCVGDWFRPKVQLIGVRGAPGNTINHPTSYWIPNQTCRVFVPKVDVVSGVGYDRIAELPKANRQFHEIRRVVTNLAVFDFESPDHRMRLRSVHPGVDVQKVMENTGFELMIPADLSITRLPTEDELRLLRKLDPTDRAQKEVVV